MGFDTTIKRLTLKKISYLTSIIIGAISLAVFIVYFFDWKTTVKILRELKITTLLMAILFFFLTVFLRAFKWTYILKQSETISWCDGFYAIMITNMANAIFPMKIGEILKLYIVNKIGEIKYRNSISASVIDRLSQFLTVMIFICFTVSAGYRFSFWPSKINLFLIVSIGAMIVFFALGDVLFVMGRKVFNFFMGEFLLNNKFTVKFLRNRYNYFIRDIISEITRSIRKHDVICYILILSFMIISIDGLCFMILLDAFSVDISWLQATVAVSIMLVLFLLPTPPGQVGTAEIYPIIIFCYGLSLSHNIISSVSIIWHIVTTIILLVLGTVSIFALGIKWSNLFNAVKDKYEDGALEKERI